MDDITTFLSQRRRLRRVMSLMLSQAQRACSGEIVSPLSLAELAEEACWSREHFVRTWTKIFQEPPVATARRIRLDLAADLLAGGASISRIAECAGFSSVQAFGHAFRRQFGVSAREFVRARQSTRDDVPRVRVVTIREPINCVGVPYTGPEGPDLEAIFDGTLNTLLKWGSKYKEWRVLGLWTVPPQREMSTDNQVELCSAVVEHNLRTSVRGLSRFSIPPGDYVRLDRARLRSQRQLDEWLLDKGWKRKDGPSIQDFMTDPVKTIPSNRRHGLLLPVVRAQPPKIPVSNLCLMPSS
jgi:AraC family transcriptional regulator